MTAARQTLTVQLAAERRRRRLLQREVRIGSYVLRRAARAGNRAGFLCDLVMLISRLTGCSAVGIRLDGTAPPAFTAATGMPLQACPSDGGFTPDCCLCARVIERVTLPHEQPLLTTGGSWLCQDLPAFYATHDAAQTAASRCGIRHCGLATLALIPLRRYTITSGLLVIGDPRPGRLQSEAVTLCERLLPLLGEVLCRFTLVDELRSSTTLLEKMFASIHVCLVLLDRNFNFLRVNQAYADIEGYSPEYFPGRNHFVLYPHEENQQIFARVVATGEAAHYFAKPFVFPQHPEWGTTFWDWSLLPMRAANGDIEGLLFCLVDVTKRQRATEELLQAQQELISSQRLADIGRLAATVAHELRNPLAAIKIAAWNVRQKAPGELLAMHLAHIDRKIADSEQIINDLLFYSRHRKARCFPLDLSTLLQECAGSVEPNLPPGVALRPLIPGNCHLIGDPLQLRELFTNLLQNAVEAMEERTGQITIDADATQATAIIKITDDGIGIAPENLPRIFDAFFTTKHTGTGLGLAVCRQIIDNHQGRISYTSRPQQGTTVTVMLPRAQSPADDVPHAEKGQ